ncbi:MAG: magnesium/cobalt transporter CorA [Bacteroidales bacterium]|nr:magnesium/cobalt transporter CorA [Bacteroidales bacterium]
MKKKKANYARKAGLPPESLVYTGDQKPTPAEIDVMVFDNESFHRERINDIAKLAGISNNKKVNLLIINNITDITLIDNVGEHFGIHPMLLEDVLNTAQLPKVEESGENLLFTLKRIDYSAGNTLIQQHVSLMLGNNYVLVFKDFENGLFADIISRIENGKSKARQKGADYLFYLLIDNLTDLFYNVVNEFNNNIDTMEATLLREPEKNHIQDIYRIKQPLTEMRGVIYPIHEAILNILQGEYTLIHESTLPYLHDVKDHVSHIIHMYESGKDTLTDLMELNSSNINNRLNKSMKILTIITTLFIPLSLIAGIYGMNFRFMPELGWKAGYPFALGLMIITAGIMLYIMKKNKLF